jgi:hypothetical protein
MNKKFTLDTIKDLKVRVKELNSSILGYYTKQEFKPDESFQLFTEQTEIPELSQDIVDKMVECLSPIDERSWDEFESGKLLFENLKLTPKQASDIGFWTYHNHYTFYPYISKRWGGVWKKEISNPSNHIVNHWIQSNSSQGELIDYPISGLWWAFYLTVDEEREDKYELTRVIFKNLSLRTKNLGAQRIGRHKPAVLAILEFINENDIPLEEATRAIIPYVNLLGGIRPLSYLDKEWFKSKLSNRFGEQIRTGKKIFIRPNETKLGKENIPVNNLTPIEQLSGQFDQYFCLNAESGNYVISNRPDEKWDYSIGLNFEIQNQFLIHFYKEGKIKKTQVNGNLSNKTKDRSKPYSNGKCPRLTLIGLEIIYQPVLFGIAYKTSHGVFFKAMDEQNIDNFRIDNSELNQEGKKVLYLDEPFKTAYKILPYEIKDALGTLLQKVPTSKGAEITNKYYADKWNVLQKHWPELFKNKEIWS